MPQYEVLLKDGRSVVLNFEDASSWERLTAGGEDAFVLLGRRLLPVQTLVDQIGETTNQAINNAIGSIGTAEPARFGKRGTWVSGATYFEDDLVEHTLSDGRVGSFLATVQHASTITPPNNPDSWQVLSLAAAGGGTGGATGYISADLATQTGNTYPVDLSLERRILLTRNTTGASGGVTFTNLGSLGNAVVAIKTPVSGTPAPFVWPSNLVWEDGITPTLSSGAGRGDVFLFESWDGIQVTGIRVRENIRFEQLPVVAAENSFALWRFPNTTANLLNALDTAKNSFVNSVGVARAPYGRDVAAGEVLYTGRLMELKTDVHVNFSNAWVAYFTYPGLLADATAANLSLFSLSATSDTPTGADNKHIRVFTNSSSGVVAAHVATREVGYTSGVAGPKDANGQPVGTLPIVDRTMHMLELSYDGAGQFQLRDVYDDKPLLDKTTGTTGPASWTALANRYIDGVTTVVPDYSFGFNFSYAPTKRPTTTVGTLSAGKGRWINIAPGNPNLTARRAIYNAARNHIASVDPSGPQLPALV